MTRPLTRTHSGPSAVTSADFAYSCGRPGVSPASGEVARAVVRNFEPRRQFVADVKTQLFRGSVDPAAGARVAAALEAVLAGLPMIPSLTYTFDVARAEGAFCSGSASRAAMHSVHSRAFQLAAAKEQPVASHAIIVGARVASEDDGTTRRPEQLTG